MKFVGKIFKKFKDKIPEANIRGRIRSKEN